MDCKTTSFNFERRRAFTLVEMLVSMGIGSIVLAIVTSLSFYSARSFAAIANYADLSAESRNALDRITSDIRGCKEFYAASTPTALYFRDGDGFSLRYEYRKGPRTLTRTKETATNRYVEVVLTECDRFEYSTFSRNPAPNYGLTVTSNANTTKLIQISWTCSRQILGKKENTESVQTAKIVLRAQKAN